MLIFTEQNNNPTPLRRTRENDRENLNAASELKEPGRSTEVYAKIKGTGRISIM